MVTERTTKEIIERRDAIRELMLTKEDANEFLKYLNQVWVLKEDVDREIKDLYEANVKKEFDAIDNNIKPLQWKCSGYFQALKDFRKILFNSPPEDDTNAHDIVSSVLKKDLEASVKDKTKSVPSQEDSSASEEDFHTDNILTCPSKVCKEHRQRWRARGV